MTRGLRRLLSGAVLVAGLAAQPALATCSRTLAPDQTETAATPLEQRFAKLFAADRFSDSAGQARRWQAFLSDARKAGGAAPEMLVRAQTWLAWSLEYSDQADRALLEGREALRLIERHGLAGSAIEAETLTVAAAIQVDNGDIAGGAAGAARALAIAERLFGARSAEASFAHNALGTVAYAQGRYAEAEREYGLATELAVACLPPSNPLIVNQMASHAGTLYMIGRTEDALDEAQRAASWAMAHVPENNPVVTLALGNLGTLLSATGRFAEAEAALHKVVDLEGVYQTESWFYRAISLSNYARALDMLGRHEEAEALWLASVGFHEKATIKRDPVIPSFPMRFAADAAQARGELSLALQRRERAAAMIDAAAPADNPERARTHLEHATTLLLLGKPSEALAIAAPAIAVVRAGYGEDDTRRMAAEIGFARILARNGRMGEAFTLARTVATGLETRLLDSATNRGDLVRYGPVFAASFSTMTELALETGRDEEAFRYLQLANLSDIVLVTSEVAARAGASDPRTSERIRDFQDSLRQRQALDRERSFALGAGDGARVADLVSRIAANDAHIAALGAELDRIAPRFRSIGRPTPVPLADFRRRLGKSEVLVAPLPLEDGTLTLLVTRQGLSWTRSATPKWDVQKMVRTIRDSIAGPGSNFDYAAARDLYRVLVPAAAESVLSRKVDMVWFASGALASLPPGLLIARDAEPGGTVADPRRVHWLLRDHSVRTAASLLAGPGSARGRASKALFLGIGAPTLDTAAGRSAGVDLSGLPELPGARRELDRIARTLGKRKSTLLTGSEASEAALEGRDLTRYAILAFATHGLVSGERVGLDEPALVLSPPPVASGGNDGLLRASEIMRLRLDADWVILSACNTASGETVGGASFGGLATAFTHAGARALLVSHWPVRDDVSAQIVVEAVRSHAAGLSAARALRQAQLRLIDGRTIADGAQPALWAPMVLVGQ